jgi:hypothetical protein
LITIKSLFAASSGSHLHLLTEDARSSGHKIGKIQFYIREHSGSAKHIIVQIILFVSFIFLMLAIYYKRTHYFLFFSS